MGWDYIIYNISRNEIKTISLGQKRGTIFGEAGKNYFNNSLTAIFNIPGLNP